MPVIWKFEHLMEDAVYLKNSAIQNNGNIMQNDIVFLQFKSSLESADKTVLVHKDILLRNHLMSLLHESYFIVSLINKGTKLDITLINSLLGDINHHIKKHKKELATAKSKIKLFVISTAALSISILILGTYFSYREYRLAEFRKRATEITSIITALVEALEARDSYTHGHSIRVALSATKLGKKMGLNESEINTLHLAAILHDIGKIGIPDSILQKPGKLTDKEYAIMKQHPVISANMLGSFENMKGFIPAILHHHESWDGTGYPNKLLGDQIPLFAQIIAICDAFDAMTSSRPYRPGMKIFVAVGEIKRCSGKQWSTQITNTFLDMIQD